MRTSWLLIGWIAGATVWMVALKWSARFRRDRARPTAGFRDYMDGTFGLRDVLSRNFYHPEKAHVAVVLRVAMLLSVAILVGSLLLAASAGSR